MEQVASTWITTCLEGYGSRARRDDRERCSSAPTARRCCRRWSGWARQPPTQRGAIDRDLVREATRRSCGPNSSSASRSGGLAEAVLRALIYIRLPEGGVDERGFAALQAIRRACRRRGGSAWQPAEGLFREQYLLLRLDEDRAVRAIPRLLPDERAARETALDALLRVRRRARRVARGGPAPPGANRERCSAAQGRRHPAKGERPWLNA